MFDFKNKVALITGGSRGIGRSCAELLAKNGCSVIINYHSNKSAADNVIESVKKLGIKAASFKADVTQTEEIKAMVDFTIREFGKIDILINSAGICEVVPYDEITEQKWDLTLDTNLKGLFFCCQSVLKHMKEKKSGKIINIASTAGQMGGFIVGMNYSASKAGVICLTKSLSKDSIKYGIHVNCVAPGLIDTEMTDAYPADKVNTMVSNIPIGRLGTAEEVAKGIVFLASDAASYIVGTTLYINGGTYLG
jgi:NAD(P)-dependent dehydrogenase (short-subunit alcohol dehydrogenase family)